MTALLEPLAPETAASDSLAIYTDALYTPPKGLHPPVQAVRPYAVQVGVPPLSHWRPSSWSLKWP